MLMLCVLSISTPQVLSHSSSTYTADALCPVSTPKFCPIFHPPTELMLRFLSLHPQVLSHSSSIYRVDALFPISNPQVLSHSSSTYRVDALCPISVPPGSVPLFIPFTELMVCVFCPVPNGSSVVTEIAQQPQPASRHITLVPDSPASSRM